MIKENLKTGLRVSLEEIHEIRIVNEKQYKFYRWDFC